MVDEGGGGVSDTSVILILIPKFDLIIGCSIRCFFNVLNNDQENKKKGPLTENLEEYLPRLLASHVIFFPPHYDIKTLF